MWELTFGTQTMPLLVHPSMNWWTGLLCCFDLAHYIAIIQNPRNAYHLTTASELFKPFGVNITTSHRLLGSAIGCVEGVNAYIEKCVTDWVSLVKKFVLVAELKH